MTTDEALKKMISTLDEDGIATCAVKDGRILAISKKKLLELVKQIEAAGSEAAIVLIKDPGKAN